MLHPELLTWVIAGDSAKILRGLEQLQLGPVEAMNADGGVAER